MKYMKAKLKKKTKKELIEIILQFRHNINIEMINLNIEEGKPYTKVIADSTKGMIRGE